MKLKKKGGFLRMLLGTLGANLLGNLLPGWGIVRVGYGAKSAGYGLKRNSDSTTSFNKLWNSEMLWKWTKI